MHVFINLPTVQPLLKPLMSFLYGGTYKYAIFIIFVIPQLYQNCSCFSTPSSEGIQGSGCEPECNTLIPFLICLLCLMIFTFSNNIPATTATLRYAMYNTPFVQSSHMVQNHTYWDANCTGGLPKQRQVKVDWYELLCFGCLTVQLVSQHVQFYTM